MPSLQRSKFSPENPNISEPPAPLHNFRPPCPRNLERGGEANACGRVRTEWKHVCRPRIPVWRGGGAHWQKDIEQCLAW
eukprot:2386282-Rhodomonas_salina.2